jgi:hypothetical protein
VDFLLLFFTGSLARKPNRDFFSRPIAVKHANVEKACNAPGADKGASPARQLNSSHAQTFIAIIKNSICGKMTI